MTMDKIIGRMGNGVGIYISKKERQILGVQEGDIISIEPKKKTRKKKHER